MEKEVFEVEEVARVLNSGFACLKVDREERPDLDPVYMNAVQAMTGTGGWPRFVSLTQDPKILRDQLLEGWKQQVEPYILRTDPYSKPSRRTT